MRRRLTILLALQAVVSTPAVAQTCLGLPSYSEGPLQVTGSSWLTREASSFGVGAGYGRASSVFGSLAIGTTSDAAVDGSSIDLGAGLGYQIPVGKSARFHLCPVASVGLGLGPKNTFNSGVDRSSKTVSVGIALATSLLAAPRLKIVPMLGVGYTYRQAKAENAAGVNLFEIAESYARLQLGVGLVLNSAISIRPGVDFALGLQAPYPTFGLTVAYAFGRSQLPARPREENIDRSFPPGLPAPN